MEIFDQKNKYLLIKFEDLINAKEKLFKKILIFIKEITKSNFEIDDKKIKKSYRKLILKN